MSALPHDRRQNPTAEKRHVHRISPVLVDFAECKTERNQRGGDDEIGEKDHSLEFTPKTSITEDAGNAPNTGIFKGF